MRYTPENITGLAPDEIFVFGSNLQGKHGAGAAAQAMKFGASYGQAFGPQGQTYAIVTKDLASRNIINMDFIIWQLVGFYNYAKNNPCKTFLLTKIGLGLAGFSLDQIQVCITFSKYRFEEEFPSNIIFPIEFTDEYINSNVRN